MNNASVLMCIMISIICDCFIDTSEKCCFFVSWQLNLLMHPFTGSEELMLRLS